MANTTVKGKFNVVAENGDVQTIYPKTTGDQVLVDRSSNASVIPNDVANLQHIVNKMGSLAFKSKVETSDFTTGTMIGVAGTGDDPCANLKANTDAGKIADALIVKNIESRVDTLENSNLVTVDELDAGLATKPDTEINDSVTSTSLTWSSKKLSDQLTELNSNTSVLTNRVDTIIAHNNDTEGNSELIDIRTGMDGTIYSAAGESVRTQVQSVNNTLSKLITALADTTMSERETEIEADSITQNMYPYSYNGIINTPATTATPTRWCGVYPIQAGKTYRIHCSYFTDTYTSGYIITDENGTVLVDFYDTSVDAWRTTDQTFTAPTSAAMVYVNFRASEYVGSVTKIETQTNYHSKSYTKEETNVFIEKSSCLDSCKLLKQKGKLYLSDSFTFSSIAGVTVSKAEATYKRNGCDSYKIVYSSGTTATFRASCNITEQVENNLGFFIYVDFKNTALAKAETNLNMYLYYSNQAGTRYRNSLTWKLHGGWNFVKINIDDRYINGTGTPDTAQLTISAPTAKNEDFTIYFNSILADSKMEPVIIIDHDGLYESDIEQGGKFDILESYQIPFTVHSSGNISSTDATTNERFFGLMQNGMADAEQYSGLDADGNLSRNILKIDNCSNAFEQYQTLRRGMDSLKENTMCGYPVAYSAPQGVCTDGVANSLKNLDFCLIRADGNASIGFFGKKDMCIGSLGIYSTGNVQSWKNAIDNAIEYGNSLILFCHEVKDNAGSYDCTKEQFEQIVSYVAEKRDSGLCSTMTLREFINACIDE